MERTDPDRLLKRVWLINGFLLLALAVLALVSAGAAWLPELFPRHQDAVAAAPGTPAEGATPRAVRFDVPERVWGTTTKLVEIHYGKDFTGAGLGALSSAVAPKYQYYYVGRQTGPLVNVAFVSEGNGAARLLFDRVVHIEAVRFPEEEADSLQRWISYDVVLDDTNGDGALDRDDGATLFVSALDGTQLRRALPEGWRLVSHGATGDGNSIVMTALRAGEGKKHESEEDLQQREQRVFIFDVVTGDLRPYAALDSVITRAGTLLAGGSAGRR
jgi:hypothetical protein